MIAVLAGSWEELGSRLVFGFQAGGFSEGLPARHLLEPRPLSLSHV